MSNSNNNSDTSARHLLVNSVVRDYSNNTSIVDIASKYNISMSSVYNYLEEKGIKPTRRSTTNLEQKNLVYKLYLEHYKLIEISKLVGINRNLVSKILKSYGVNPSGNYQRYLDVIEDKKDNLFINLNNPNTQYWLGYFAADGCVKKNNTTLSFTTKDLDLAEAFCAYAKENPKKIYYYVDPRYNLTYYSLELNNKKSCQTLISYGITARKTFSLKLNIPITYNFLAGLLDGDGSVTKTDLSWITASEAFQIQICDFLETEGFNYSSTLREGKYYVIRFNKRNNCRRFIESIYKDLDFYLARKYQVIMTEFKNW